MDQKAHTFHYTPDDYQDSLASAALFQGNFSIDWILELTQKKASQVILELEEGIQRGWLVKRRPGVFRFADSKAQQKWLDYLSPEEKERLNRHIANMLLRELPNDDRKAQDVAHHLLRISNDLEGCRWLIRAGDVHVKAFRNEEALQCYLKVFHDLSKFNGEEADDLFTETAIKYSKISTARHDTTKVLSILEEAIKKANTWKKQSCEALLEMHLAKNEWLRSRYRSALNHFEKGWSMAKEVGDSKLLRSATTFSTIFFYWQGRFLEAVRSYEQAEPEVEKYPKSGFPNLAAQTVGYCYSQIGQITQGLGMLDAIRKHSMEKGDRYFASNAASAMAAIMIDIRRLDDALQHLEYAIQEATQEKNDWVLIRGNLMLAFIYYLKKDNKRAMVHLRKFLRHSKRVHVTLHYYPYVMELCWAMEQGMFPALPDLTLEKEIHRMIRSENIFMKGVAYRYKALLQRRAGLPYAKIMDSLNQSIKWLEKSGQQIEPAKSRLELARQYLLLGKKEKARETVVRACKVLSSFHEALVPDDLRSLIKESSSGEDLIKEILKLGQEVVTIRDSTDLVHRIISAVNRITGAERGAIFLLDESSRPAKLGLRGSKNLTSEQIADPGFYSSIRLIEEVAATNKARIVGENTAKDEGEHAGEIIRSRICVPMKLRDKVVGVLYHDNRLLSSAFKESDLELLAYFAGQAAFALDNARAYDEINRLNQNLREEKMYYEEQHLESLNFEDIVGESAAIKRVLAQIDQVAGTDTTVLILGETGVGKELVARAIHRLSPRSHKPFIRVHCSALPESLIPSELFGHEKGAFTGATSRRIGRFELANGGTLFLDEIGDLSLDIQVRLLRILQSKEFERVGGSETLSSDFRLVAATNLDMEQAVKAHRFRADLYYRINVLPIYVPPLRERKEDIPLLAHHFVKIHTKKMRKAMKRVSDEEMYKLIQYNWPGNVRELENIIERGCLLSHGQHFQVPELSVNRLDSRLPEVGDVTLQENERRHILWALLKTRWKVRGREGAAELLDVHPSTLAFKMKKLGIQRPPEFSRRNQNYA